MAAYRIERMGLADLGAVVAMWEAFEAERGFVPSDAQALAFGEVMLDAARPEAPGAVLVARVGKHAAGFLWARYCETPYGRYPRVLLGDAFYVRPKYRHHEGIAYALYAASRDLATALKATPVIECRVGDESLYTKRGFVPVSTTLMLSADAPPWKGD